MHSVDEVPPIVHQTAPTNRQRWDPRWAKCRQSWRQACPAPGYDHRFWDDDDLRDMVLQAFPEFIVSYDGYSEPIQRVDFARSAMLFLHGGLYVDMDVEAFGSPFPCLPAGKVSVVASPYKQNEKHQNSMMASPPRHPFWRALAQEAVRRFHSTDGRRESTWWLTGPQLLDAVVAARPHDVHVLPVDRFNPAVGSLAFHAACVITRHLCTSVWTHSMDREGMSLYEAARVGDATEVVKAIRAGADVHCNDRAGLTPLHHAALRGDANICKILLGHDADVNVCDLNDATPCHYGVQSQSEVVVAVLLAARADLFVPLRGGSASGMGPAALARCMALENRSDAAVGVETLILDSIANAKEKDKSSSCKGCTSKNFAMRKSSRRCAEFFCAPNVRAEQIWRQRKRVKRML